MSREHTLTAILPCNDLDASEAFYGQLGLAKCGGQGDYRILSYGRGGEEHLTQAVEGWLIRGRNPIGLYLYAENVAELARRMANRTPERKPRGMLEFALSDPDETLVRIGWPAALRQPDPA